MTTYATSERTRGALIDAAGELFTRYGIDAVSTRAIAERAGENIGSIHYHFGGKKGLLQAALDVFFEAWEDEPLHRVWDKHRDSLSSPHVREAFLEELVQTFFDRVYFAGRPWWCAGLLYQLFTYENDLSDQFIERHVRPHHELLQEVAKHLHPEFDDEQAFVWSQLLVGPIISLALKCGPCFRVSGAARWKIRIRSGCSWRCGARLPRRSYVWHGNRPRPVARRRWLIS